MWTLTFALAFASAVILSWCVLPVNRVWARLSHQFYFKNYRKRSEQILKNLPNMIPTPPPTHPIVEIRNAAFEPMGRSKGEVDQARTPCRLPSLSQTPLHEIPSNRHKVALREHRVTDKTRDFLSKPTWVATQIPSPVSCTCYLESQSPILHPWKRAFPSTHHSGCSEGSIRAQYSPHLKQRGLRCQERHVVFICRNRTPEKIEDCAGTLILLQGIM